MSTSLTVIISLIAILLIIALLIIAIMHVPKKGSGSKTIVTIEIWKLIKVHFEQEDRKHL